MWVSRIKFKVHGWKVWIPQQRDQQNEINLAHLVIVIKWKLLPLNRGKSVSLKGHSFILVESKRWERKIQQKLQRLKSLLYQSRSKTLHKKARTIIIRKIIIISGINPWITSDFVLMDNWRRCGCENSTTYHLWRHWCFQDWCTAICYTVGPFFPLICFLFKNCDTTHIFQASPKISRKEWMKQRLSY